MSSLAVIEPDPLTLKQRRFVDEYLVDLNATAAAKRAGYSPRSAHGVGYNLRHDPKVAQEIAKALDAMTGITRNHIVNELARIVNAKIDDVVTWDKDGLKVKDSAELNADQKAGIAKITQTERGDTREIRVEMFNKLDAIDKLSRVLQVVNEGGGKATAAVQINVNFPPGTDALLYGPKIIEGKAS